MVRVAGARRRKLSDDFGEDIIIPIRWTGLLYFTTIILCVIDCFATISWTFPHQQGEDEVIVTIILAFSMERYTSMTDYDGGPCGPCG